MRQVFLKRREKEETERAYLEMAQNIDVEWDQVKTKIAAWSMKKKIYFLYFCICHFISVLLWKHQHEHNLFCYKKHFVVLGGLIGNWNNQS